MDLGWLLRIRKWLGALTDALLEGRKRGWWNEGPKP